MENENKKTTVVDVEYQLLLGEYEEFGEIERWTQEYQTRVQLSFAGYEDYFEFLFCMTKDGEPEVYGEVSFKKLVREADYFAQLNEAGYYAQVHKEPKEAHGLCAITPQGEFVPLFVQVCRDLAREANAWLEQPDGWSETWYALTYRCDNSLDAGSVDRQEVLLMAEKAMKNNPGTHVSVAECRKIKSEEGYDFVVVNRTVLQDWRTADGGHYDLLDAECFGTHYFRHSDHSWRQGQTLYRTKAGESVLTCCGDATTPWAITDKDGSRKTATLLIPLTDDEAELWKNHKLDDDDALMKIVLSFKGSIEYTQRRSFV